MKPILLIALILAWLQLPAQITITGSVINKKDSVITFIETDGFTNITRSWRDKHYKFPIDSNNRFVAVLPENDINRWLIKTENGYQFFDLVKGNNIKLLVDFTKKNPLTAHGNNAADFNYLVYAAKKIKPDAAHVQTTQSKNIDTVLLARKKMAAAQIKVLDRYKSIQPMSEAYYRWIKAKYEYEPYERTWVENISNKDSIDDITLSKILEKGINNDEAAMYSREYNDLAGAYMRQKFAATKLEPTLDAHFNFAAGNLLKGKTRDVYITRVVAWALKSHDSIYNPIFKRYNELVQDETIKNHLRRERESFVTHSKRKLEPIANFTALNEIFSQYKNKVIYIDFWASWCAPCRAEIPHAAELKKRLKNDEDIVFVYLGYRDTQNAWAKAKTDLDIEGEHYFLDERLAKEAAEVFNISGIPHYAIIDKGGNIVSKRAGRPHEVYNQLLTLAAGNQQEAK